MRVAIVGGKLQGTETVYLARKAGWETILLDREADVPAAGLCDAFIPCDVTSIDAVAQFPGNVDLIVPALENIYALKALNHISATLNIPFLFDIYAFELTSSKIRSNQLFTQLKLPVAAMWPTCEFPVLVKPDADSGSKGIKVFESHSKLEQFFQSVDIPDNWVVQEYIQGPSFSLEVIGSPGNYIMPQVTDLFMDRNFDCKRVCAPTVMPPEHVTHLKQITLQIAEELQLNGIMDVEVILTDEGLKLLEIDARFPSQTPAAVYWSTGINMLELLKDRLFEVTLPEINKRRTWRHVIFEHIRIRPNVLEVAGEDMMSKAGKLSLYPNFFGSDEAITNFVPGRQHWEATMIYTAKYRHALLTKRMHAIETLRNKFECDIFFDSSPSLLKQPSEAVI